MENLGGKMRRPPDPPTRVVAADPVPVVARGPDFVLAGGEIESLAPARNG